MEQVKRLRIERGLSQVKLAARAGINPSTLNQIERGAREASPATLRKLAAALDVSISELLGEGDYPKEPQPEKLSAGAEIALYWRVLSNWDDFTRDLLKRIEDDEERHHLSDEMRKRIDRFDRELAGSESRAG